MSKKRIITIVTSLLIICGIGYGTYASVSQGSKVNQVAKSSSSHSSKGDAKPTTVTLDGKTKKKSKITKAEQKKEAAQSMSASQKSSAKEVAAKKDELKKSEVKKAEEKKTQADGQSDVVAAPAAQQAQDDQPAQDNQTVNTNKPVESTPAPQPAVTKSVKLSIYGPISEGDQKWLNGDDVEIKDGDMVIDVLKRDLQSKGMALSYKGTGATVYVRGIKGLFEFDRGGQSGWLYRVNGVFPDHSCGNYPVKSGDVIDWMYTENLGNDRNAPQG